MSARLEGGLTPVDGGPEPADGGVAAERALRARVLAGISALLASESDPMAALVRLVEIAVEVSKASAGCLFVHEESHGFVRPLINVTPVGATTSKALASLPRRLVSDVPSFHRALLEQRVVTVCSTQVRRQLGEDLATFFSGGHVAVVPLRMPGRGLGILVLADPAELAPAPGGQLAPSAVAELVVQVAKAASVSLRQVVDLEHLTRVQHQLDALTEISAAIMASREIGEVLQAVVELAASLVGGGECRICLPDDEETEPPVSPALLHTRAATPGSSFCVGETVGAPGSISAWVVANRRPILVLDLERGLGEPSLDFLANRSAAYRSILTVPVAYGNGRSCGVLAVGHPEPFRFVSRDLTVLARLAQQTAVALDNRRLLDGVSAAAKMLRSEAETLRAYQQMVEKVRDGVAVVADDGTILFANAAYAEMHGYQRDELVGDGSRRLIGDPDGSGEMTLGRLTARALKAGHAFGEMRRVRKDGSAFTAGVSLTHVQGEDAESTRWIVVVRDHTERRRLVEELAYRASHDPLTGLPNRETITERVRNALRASRSAGHTIAVLFVDVDHFKTVNDSLGHAAGDEVLRSVARRLRRCLRSEDSLGRLSGDEFVVLVDQLDGLPTATALAGRLLEELTQPFWVEGRTVTATASIGLAVADTTLPDDVAEAASALLSRADAAMYSAKDAGRRRVALWTPEMTTGVVSELALVEDLRGALWDPERKGLWPAFQPVVDLRSGRLAGLEVLARWEHATLGALLPSAFLGAAERHGLMVELGMVLIEQAADKVAQWRRSGRSWIDGVVVSVNLSGVELSEEDRADSLLACWERRGLPPETLGVEVTETSLLRTGSAAVTENLYRLARAGVHLALDDFGTGFSSVSHLRELPVSTIKLDRSYVTALGRPDTDARIAASLVSLAQALDLTVVAEGVEDAATADAVARLGCQLGQGWFFGRPEPAEVLAERLG